MWSVNRRRLRSELEILWWWQVGALQSISLQIILKKHLSDQLWIAHLKTSSLYRQGVRRFVSPKWACMYHRWFMPCSDYCTCTTLFVVRILWGRNLLDRLTIVSKGHGCHDCRKIGKYWRSTNCTVILLSSVECVLSLNSCLRKLNVEAIAIHFLPHRPCYLILIATLFMSAQFPCFLSLAIRLFDASCHIIYHRSIAMFFAHTDQVIWS